MNCKTILERWLTNYVIPQVYDDSLSYYEQMNKILCALQEVSGALDNTIEGLKAKIEKNKTDLATETTERTEANAALRSSINSEITDRTLAYNRLETKIDNETERAEAAEADNARKLETETATRTSEDNKLKGLIETNKTDADTKYSNLNTALESETTTRQQADDVLRSSIETAKTTLSGKIDDEKRRAIEKEAINAGNITTEKANRISADEEITQKITDEKTRAEKSELNLSKMINSAQNKAPAVETTQEAEKLTVFEIAKHFDNDGKQTKKETTTPVKMQIIDDAGVYYEMALTSYDDLVALQKLVSSADNLADLGTNAMMLLTSSFHKDTSENVDTIYIETFNNNTGEVTR